MSYDLYFRSKRGPVSGTSFKKYFAARPFFTANESEAVYQNERTGVYFSFNHSEEDGESETGDDAPNDGTASARVSFNMNYMRPHVFAWEAAPEIEAFVEYFGLTVDDPQNEGNGRGAFSIDGFLKGWNAGNAFAYRSYASLIKAGQVSVSKFIFQSDAEVERVWNWNWRLEERQSEIGDVFVPKISYVNENGKAVSFIVWGDLIPIVLPPVDKYLLIRRELLGRPADGSQDSMALVDSSSFAKFVGKFPMNPENEFRILKMPQIQPELFLAFQQAPELTENLDGLQFGNILSRELAMKAGIK